MTQLFTNNGVSTLAAGILAGDLALTVAAGHGALFPSPTGGDYFLVTLEHPPAPTLPLPDQRAREIVKVTARTGDVFTIVRAQEGTTAAAWALGDVVDLRETAGTLAALQTGPATAAALGTVKLSGTPTDAANPVTYVKEQTDTLLAAKAASSHSHAEADVTGLVADLAAIVSTLGGKATPADISAAIAALVASSPATLDTLNELAAALGDDANFAATVTNALAGKQPLDALLTALAALGSTAGLLEQTGADTPAIRLLGVGASTSVPTLADADARYQAGLHGVRPLSQRWICPFGAVVQNSTYGTPGYIFGVPLTIRESCQIDALGIRRVSGVAGGLVRLGLYACGPGNLPTGALIVDAGTLDGTVAGWGSLVLGAPVTLSPGVYFPCALTLVASCTVQTFSIVGNTGMMSYPSTMADGTFNSMAGYVSGGGYTGALPSSITLAEIAPHGTPARVFLRFL